MRQTNTDVLAQAAERVIDQDESEALSLVGARVGRWHVTGREKPGQRWLYVLLDTKSGLDKRVRGYELVRLIREARTNGVSVTHISPPWRDEN